MIFINGAIWFKKSTPWKSEETKLGGGHRARTTIFFKAKPGNFEDWCQFMKAKDKKHVFVTKLFYTVSGSVTPTWAWAKRFELILKKCKKRIIYKKMQYFSSFLAPDFIFIFLESKFSGSCYRQLSFFEKKIFIFLEVPLSVD